MSERRRLSPDDRRAQLLDIAKSTVEHHGVSACTVERVAEHAGVTSQLVHKYFGTRMSLLGALLEREDARYQSAVRASLAEATSFEQVVRFSSLPTSISCPTPARSASSGASPNLRTGTPTAGEEKAAGPNECSSGP